MQDYVLSIPLLENRARLRTATEHKDRFVVLTTLHAGEIRQSGCGGMQECLRHCCSRHRRCGGRTLRNAGHLVNAESVHVAEE